MSPATKIGKTICTTSYNKPLQKRATMTWTEDQFSGHAPHEVWESFVDHNVCAAMMIGVFVICMGYPLTHRTYVRYCRPYQALSREQQLVVIQHTIEAVMLSLLFAPLTYLLLSINFEEQEDLESFHKKVSAAGSLMFIVIIMHMVELASQYEHSRALVIAHPKKKTKKLGNLF
jgi:hypothetical protein